MSADNEELDAMQLAIQELRKSRTHAKAASIDANCWFWRYDVKPRGLVIEGKAYLLGEDGEYYDWPEGMEIYSNLVELQEILK